MAGSRIGSRIGIGNGSARKAKPEDDKDDNVEEALTRLRKENETIVADMGLAEEEAKEAERIATDNEELRKEIASLRQRLVSSGDIAAVIAALKAEKAAIASLQIENEALGVQVMNRKKKGKRKLRTSM